MENSSNSLTLSLTPTSCQDWFLVFPTQNICDVWIGFYLQLLEDYREEEILSNNILTPSFSHHGKQHTDIL